MNSSFLLLTEHQPELTLLQRSEHRHRRSKQVSGQFPQAAASPPSRPHLDGPGPPPLAVLGARPAGAQLLVVSARLAQRAATARRHLPGRRRSPRSPRQAAACQAHKRPPPPDPAVPPLSAAPSPAPPGEGRAGPALTASLRLLSPRVPAQRGENGTGRCRCCTESPS